MIKLFKYILLSLLIVNICKADFEGFPISSNWSNWGEARTNQYMLQLFEAVQERCWAVTNRMTPPNIVETWSVQIGFTNQIFTRDYLTNDVPPLYKTVTYTNRLPWYATVVTTNVCTNVTYNISDIDPNTVGNSSFVPFTNNPSTVTLSLPITRGFITGLDNKMFAITPYYVDLTMTNEYGKFDDWFKRKVNLMVRSPADPPPDGGGYAWQIQPYGGDVGTMPVDVIGKYTWRYYADNHVPAVYTDWRTDWGFNSHTMYYPQYPNINYDQFVTEQYPEYYPMLSPATVITNAHIGYCTNVFKDVFGHITNGVAYFTRQPLATTEWTLWQATRDKAVITLSGFGDPLDGNYYKCQAKDLNQTYVANYGSYWAGLGSFTFNDDEVYQRESGKAAIVKITNLYFPSDNLVHPYLVFQTTGSIMDALRAPSYVELNQLSTNMIFDPDWGDIYSDWGTALTITNTSSTNGWRLLNPWWSGFGNPPAADPARKSDNSTNLLWITKDLNAFDTRYYDIQPRPFYRYTNPKYVTNGTPLTSVNLNLGGTAFIDFNDPDVFGSQTVRGADEAITLNNKYTASNYRWYQTLSNSISGNAPLGATIVLMWTNDHSYGNLPYQLEAKDLDERELYLKQLLWTTTPYWKWTNCVKNNVGGYTNIYNIDSQISTNFSLNGYTPNPNAYSNWLNASQGNWWEFLKTSYPTTGSNDLYEPSHVETKYPWLTTYDFSNPNLTPVSPPASAAPYATVSYSSSFAASEECDFISPYVFNGNTNYNHDTFYLDYPWFPGYFQVSGKQYDLSAATVYAYAWQEFSGYQIGSLQWTYQSDTRLSHVNDFYIRQNTDKVQGTYSNATTTANAPTYSETSDLFTPDLVEPTIPDSTRLVSPYFENFQVNNYPFYYDVYPTNYHGTLMTNWFTDTIYTYASTNWAFTNDFAAAYYHDNTLGPPPDYPMVLDGYGGFWAPDGHYRGSTVFYTPTGYVNGVYQEIPHNIYNRPVVAVPYYVSNSTYYLEIPKVEDPPKQGITAWTQVITNTFTTNIVLTQIINTNPVTWIAETAYGTAAYATGLVSGWVAAHKLNQDYWSNPQFGQPGQNWGGFATFGPLWTNVYTNVVIGTNVFTEYLYWKPEELHYEIIAVQPTQFLNSAMSSQTHSGSSYTSIEGLDPIMKWNENNGFKRK